MILLLELNLFHQVNLAKDLILPSHHEELETVKEKRRNRIKCWNEIYVELKNLYSILSINVRNYLYFVNKIKGIGIGMSNKYEINDNIIYTKSYIAECYVLDENSDRPEISSVCANRILIKDKMKNIIRHPIYLISNVPINMNYEKSNLKLEYFSESLIKYDVNLYNVKNLIKNKFTVITDIEEIKIFCGDYIQNKDSLKELPPLTPLTFDNSCSDYIQNNKKSRRKILKKVPLIPYDTNEDCVEKSSLNYNNLVLDEIPIRIEINEQLKIWMDGYNFETGLIKFIYNHDRTIYIKAYRRLCTRKNIIYKVKKVNQNESTTLIYNPIHLILEKKKINGELIQIVVHPEYDGVSCSHTISKHAATIYPAAPTINPIVMDKSNYLEQYYGNTLALFAQLSNEFNLGMDFSVEDIKDPITLNKLYKCIHHDKRKKAYEIQFVNGDEVIKINFRGYPGFFVLTSYKNNEEVIYTYVTLVSDVFCDNTWDYKITKIDGIVSSVKVLNIFSEMYITYTWDEYFEHSYGKHLRNINEYLFRYNKYKGCNYELKREHLEERVLNDAMALKLGPCRCDAVLDDIILRTDYNQGELELHITFTDKDKKHNIGKAYIDKDKIIEAIDKDEIVEINKNEIKIYNKSDFNKEYYTQEFLDECNFLIKKFDVNINRDLTFDDMTKLEYDDFYNCKIFGGNKNHCAEFNINDSQINCKIFIGKDEDKCLINITKYHDNTVYIDKFIYRYGNDVSTKKKTIKDEKVEYTEIKYTKLNNNEDVEMEWVINNNNKLEVKTNGSKIPNKIIYGYKAVKSLNSEPCIAKLQLLPESKVATADNKKMRTDKVKVLGIFKINIDEDKISYDIDNEITTATSSVHPSEFMYNKGEIAYESNFDPDLSKVCVPGIHFVFSQEDALKFHKIDNKLISNYDALEEYGRLDNLIDDDNVNKIKVNFDESEHEDKSKDEMKDEKKEAESNYVYKSSDIGIKKRNIDKDKNLSDM